MITAIPIVISGEVWKGLRTSWTYKTNTLISLVTLALIFLGIAYFMQGGVFDADYMTSTLLGYVTWMYTALAISDMSNGLSREMQTGTLEQMSMSPVPVAIILLGRVLANLIITTLQVAIMVGSMMLVFGIRFPLRWQGVPVLTITWLGILGFGYLIAGAMLILKQVAALAGFLNNMLAFFNGSFLPIAALPAWLAAIARILPSTQGIEVLRKVVLDGKSLIYVWKQGSLIWLCVHSALFLVVGTTVYILCERIARKKGTLGQY